MLIAIILTKKFVYITTPYLFLTRTINLAIQIFVGVVSYSIVIYSLKVNEIKWLFENSKLVLSKFRDLVAK